MGVDVGVIAGIGFEAGALFRRFPENPISKDYFTREDYMEKEEFFENLFSEKEGSNSLIDFMSDMNGDIYELLFAKDPIFGLDLFLQDLADLGFTGLTKHDLCFIEDYYYW